MSLNQKLTEAIHALIPKAGLMDLKVGQRVKHSGRDCMHGCEIYEGEISYISRPTDRGWKIYCLETGEENHEEDISCCGKILGIEPELRHVLWALDATMKPWWYAEELTYSVMTLCFPNEVTVDYDLTKSLYAQEDSTKEFILNLLTK